MAGKQAGTSVARVDKWKFRFSLLVGVVLIVAVCAVVRHYWRPDLATAQGPPRQASKQGSSKGNRGAKNSPKPSINTTNLKILAVVNGQEITRQQLAHEAMRRYGDDVLKSLVNKHLILAACQQRGIVITQKDVADELTRIASKFGLSTDRLLHTLQEERGLTPQQYSNDIVWPTLALRRLAAKQIEVTREEIDKMMESELGPRVQVRLISVGNRQKADQIHKLAVADPEQFGTLAKDHSEDRNSASAYGLIPPIRRHVGNAEVERAAYSLREGEVSQVVSVANQHLILKCEKQIPSFRVGEKELQDAERRIVDHLRDKKLRTVAAQIFKQLQTEAKVVNIFNDPQKRQYNPGVAALINNQQLSIRELSEECIARHGLEVLNGEINRQLLIKELTRRKVTVEKSDIDQEIARAADTNGYVKKDGSGKADIEAWLKAVTKQDEVTVDLYVRDSVWPSVALKKLVASQIKVAEEDMRKGFEANYGPRIDVLAIVLSNHRQAQQVWEMARNNPTDQAFGGLAKQYSIEPVSAANMGKVPPIQRYGGRPLVEEEAFRLKTGEISGIIAVGKKYVILRCRGRTKPVVQDFQAVRDQLYSDIYEKKLRLTMAKEFDRLRETAQIDNLLAGTTQSGKRPTNAKSSGVTPKNPYSLPRTADRKTTLPSARP